MTKVDAIKKVMEANGGSANWKEIYEAIGPEYKTAVDWKAGIRGVLYREIRNGKTFKKLNPARFGLRSAYKGKSHKTGEIVDLTEAQVRAEIVETLQHDMSTSLEYTDDEIVDIVNDNDPDDYFDGSPSFEGWNYEVTRAGI